VTARHHACLQARARLAVHKQELEEVMREMEQRLEEDEERMNLYNAEKKKLLTNVRDLEEQ